MEWGYLTSKDCEKIRISNQRTNTIQSHFKAFVYKKNPNAHRMCATINAGGNFYTGIDQEFADQFAGEVYLGLYDKEGNLLKYKKLTQDAFRGLPKTIAQDGERYLITISDFSDWEVVQ